MDGKLGILAVGFGLCICEEDWFAWVDNMTEYLVRHESANTTTGENVLGLKLVFSLHPLLFSICTSCDG